MSKLNNLAALHAFAAILFLGNFDTASAQLTVNPTSLSFTAPVGGPAPSAQLFSTAGSGFSAIFTSVEWVQFTPNSGPAGTVVTVSINMAKAPTVAGFYPGQIQIIPTSGNVVLFPVNLTLTPGSGGTSSLSTSPASLAFNYPTGSQQQSVQLSTTQATSVTYTATPSSNPAWLQVAPTSGSVAAGSPATVNVIINTQLAATMAPGSYTGTVTFTAPNTNPFVLQVTLTTGASSQLQVSPSTVSFFYQVNQSAPAPQIVTLTATGASTIFFSAVPIIDSGPTQWLSVAPVSAVAQPGSPALITATANVAGLPVGTYQARIIITPTSGGVSTFSIPVSLTISNNALLTATPTSLSYNYQSGLPNPATQTVSIGASAGTINNLTATASTQTGGNWLSAALSQTTTPATLTVTVSASSLGLSTGTYTGSIAVSSPSAGNTLSIQVTLNVTNNPLIVAAPSSMSFAYQTGQSIPQSQTLHLTSSGAPIAVSYSAATTSGGNWLSVTGTSGNTPVDLAVSILAPQALQAGTYSGNITVTSAGSGNSPLNIPVTLVVSASAMLSVSPNSITFTTTQGGTTQLSAIASVTSTDNSQIGYSVQWAAPWLFVGPVTGTTSPPVNLQVLALPGSLAPGTYTADITITATSPANVPNSPQKIPVTLRITSGNTIVAAPTSMNFTQTVGGAIPATQTLAVSSSAAAFSVQATAVALTGGGWLTVTPSSGITPLNFTVKADGTNLSAGTYTGNITLQSADAATVTIPVTLTIAQAPTASASPSSLVFAVNAGQPTPAQQISLSLSSGSGNYTASVSVASPAGGTWLSATPLTGALPATLTVSINSTGLGAGTYNGSIAISVPGAANSLSIPVSLTVSGTELSVSPATMGFNYQIGTPGLPPSQTLNVTTVSGAPVSFSVTAAVASGNTTWLTVTPGSGQTPANLTVTANPANLPPGSYTGTITVSSSQVLGAPTRTVAVTLVVSQPAVQPTIQQVLHGASLDPTPLSPGLIFTIKGTQLGPVTPQGLIVTNGFVTTVISTVRVFVDDIPCPLLYVSATQINAVAPYAIANRTSVRVQTEFQGARSNTVSVSAIPTAPGIFTAGTGRGQGAILNEDNSFNALTPTARNKVVAIYATGDGVENPPALDGFVTTALRRPIAPVTVTIAGISAVVEYAGAAPGLVSGVLQVNVRVPDSVPSGNVPVVIVVGSAQSQIGVTLNVQ
jgi:uncharacterized protein (TIGR03437 family)